MLYSLNVTSADSSRGGITIITQPTCEDAQAQFQANAYNGYHFDHWSDGNTDNPRYLELTSDTTIMAYFVSDSDEGIDVSVSDSYTIHTTADCIVVEGVTDETVRLYDMTGRCLQTLRATEQCTLQVPTAGVYLLQVGDSPVQKVVVVR